MKLPAFNNDARRWDAYRAFHNLVGNGFIRFESGELIYIPHSPDPDERHMYLDHSVHIVATTDVDCPPLYLPDGTRAIPAWLNRDGLQYLCIDRDLGVAVRLLGSRWTRDKHIEQDLKVPSYLRCRFSVYWSGEGSKPIGAPITVAPPKKLTSDEKAHLQSLKDQCNAWHAMMGIEGIHGYTRTVTLPNGDRIWLQPTAQDPSSYLMRSFVDLTDKERVIVAETGWATCYDVTKYDYLSVVKP